ncbi:hypothetical protein IC614_02850 [Allosphingosinicella flava]|uniref:Uncharacterized protein n=1 Tax=Allosphingosinicella flava TaxID=2771430 RepID=A0A7T2GKL5_9SPHN|nr:hypothetical protein [Sphingosinicella flava]QPQ55557.1 hypothetical protein IC614_02850 [Sphingosinicella flava]
MPLQPDNTTPETKAPDTVRLEPCEVTQEDREAFKQLWLKDLPEANERLDDGLWDDDPRMLILARHRLNTRPLSLPKGEEVERRECDICHAIVATMHDEVLCCHCQTVPWRKVAALSTKAPAQGDVERIRAEALEEAAKVAEARAAICEDAIQKIKAGELYPNTSALAGATERCAMHEASHIAKEIRALASMSPTLSPKDYPFELNDEQTHGIACIIADALEIKLDRHRTENGGWVTSGPESCGIVDAARMIQYRFLRPSPITSEVVEKARIRAEAFEEAARIASGQQTDDSQVCDGNEMCRHIAAEIRAYAALSTPLSDKTA